VPWTSSLATPKESALTHPHLGYWLLYTYVKSAARGVAPQARSLFCCACRSLHSKALRSTLFHNSDSLNMFHRWSIACSAICKCDKIRRRQCVVAPQELKFLKAFWKEILQLKSDVAPDRDLDQKRAVSCFCLCPVCRPPSWVDTTRHEACAPYESQPVCRSTVSSSESC
jgi:hypothetical protein